MKLSKRRNKNWREEKSEATKSNKVRGGKRVKERKTAK